MIQGAFYSLNERMRTVDSTTAAYLMSLIHAAAADEGFDVNPMESDAGYDEEEKE